jgi:hypothetical protein
MEEMELRKSQVCAQRNIAWETYENEALRIKHVHDNEKGIEGVVLQYGN